MFGLRGGYLTAQRSVAFECGRVDGDRVKTTSLIFGGVGSSNVCVADVILRLGSLRLFLLELSTVIGDPLAAPQVNSLEEKCRRA